jgi:hypothetical protein
MYRRVFSSSNKRDKPSLDKPIPFAARDKVILYDLPIHPLHRHFIRRIGILQLAPTYLIEMMKQYTAEI